MDIPTYGGFSSAMTQELVSWLEVSKQCFDATLEKARTMTRYEFIGWLVCNAPEIIGDYYDPTDSIDYLQVADRWYETIDELEAYELGLQVERDTLRDEVDSLLDELDEVLQTAVNRAKTPEELNKLVELSSKALPSIIRLLELEKEVLG